MNYVAKQLMLILLFLFVLLNAFTTPNIQENFMSMDDLKKEGKTTYNKSIRYVRNESSSLYNNITGWFNRGMRKGFFN